MVTLPDTIQQFARHFFDAGYELYVVGGAVRDRLLHMPGDDFDFATSARPEEVQSLFDRVIPTGIQHGTVTVLYRKHAFEVTTYRTDGTYSDQRHPDSVTYTSSLEEDLSRRDFTINAIALDPRNGTLIDPFEGRTDLENGIIRSVGTPIARFGEDALRMLRAVRFATILGFTLDPEIIPAMKTLAPSIQRVSHERIAMELRKMMRSAQPSRGWRMLNDATVLGHIIPELNESFQVEQLFEHLLQTCDCVPEAATEHMRWAALFHDIGKPRCIGSDHRGTHFIGHDTVSAAMAEKILQRLRFPNEIIQPVCHLIKHHMFSYTSDFTDAAIRRFIARVGEDSVNQLIDLRLADGCGKTGRRFISEEMKELSRRVDTIIAGQDALHRSDLAINGRDLMEEAGIPPGRVVGIVLEELLEVVLDDPGMNTRQTLLHIARNIKRQKLSPP